MKHQLHAAVPRDRGGFGSPAVPVTHAELAKTRQSFASAETLPGAVYTSPGVFELERRGLFARQWVCIGRARDVATAGDFLAVEVAGNPLLLLRDGGGRLGAFYNVCRHRGSRLVDSCQGHASGRLVCPYHAWSYNLDGSLHSAPQMPPGFDRAASGLVPVRCAEWQGFVFVNLDESAPALAEALAEMPDLARFRMADLVCGKRIEYDVAANWKLLTENYSECYHCAGAHPQLHRLTESIGRNEREMEVGNCFNGGPMRLRAGVETMSNSGRRSLPTIPGLSHDDCRYVHYYVVYPNMLLSPHPDYVLVHTVWPLAADRTRIVCEWLVTAEAAAASDFDPSDIVDFWDITNRQDWQLCERTQAGVASRGYRQGPYQSSEDCVHTFDRWYADQLDALI